ncbi:hypothetical protein B9Z55_008989 [Caenorhabditis nigoni]|uniref:Uncharacterized protein n=1 Tax=Caenorhabditis nigoni TaxID=1611254 RepID=A0A2G5UQ56_9PELO|nr:hypothetical protein B9Z55_008989 [Caenorhabditis nigoni]
MAQLSRYIPRRPIFKTIHLDKTLTLTIDPNISYATEVQLDETIFFIGTFVTGKKKTTIKTINTRLPRAKEETNFVFGEIF